MKVFISYSHRDIETAKSLTDFLDMYHILYDWDRSHDNLPTDDPDELVQTLHSAIGVCSHIIAVISENTKQSPWVPYEIGFGVASNLKAATYGLSYLDVPAYLEIWPNFSKESHLLKFILDQLEEERVLAKGILHEKLAFKRESFYVRMKKITGQIR